MYDNKVVFVLQLLLLLLFYILFTILLFFIELYSVPQTKFGHNHPPPRPTPYPSRINNHLPSRAILGKANSRMANPLHQLEGAPCDAPAPLPGAIVTCIYNSGLTRRSVMPCQCNH